MTTEQCLIAAFGSAAVVFMMCWFRAILTHNAAVQPNKQPAMSTPQRRPPQGGSGTATLPRPADRVHTYDGVTWHVTMVRTPSPRVVNALHYAAPPQPPAVDVSAAEWPLVPPNWMQASSVAAWLRSEATKRREFANAGPVSEVDIYAAHTIERLADKMEAKS